MESIIGVYKIKNKINNKYYIGSSLNIKERFKGHLYLLKKNKSHSPKLQSAFNKYGRDNFVFEIIEICLLTELIEKERLYIDYYNSVKNGYNCSNDTKSPRRGMRH